jgi:hypothetical protein
MRTYSTMADNQSPLSTAAFSAMHGGAVLTYVRDTLLKIADDKRRLLKASAEISQIPIAAADLKEIAVIEAAIDITQFAISAGEEARLRKNDPPEWVLRLAGQARAALAQSDEEDAA